MPKKNKVKSNAGKLGALATHRTRYETLKELTKFVDRDFMGRLVTWPTEHLKRLLVAYKKQK